MWTSRTAGGRAYWRLVTCFAVMALLLTANGQVAHATHLPPPTAVSLTTSDSEITAGETFTLTATANGDVYHTTVFIQIFNLTSNTAVRGCTSGSVCTYGPASFESGPPRSYEARLVNTATLAVVATSEVVTISRAPWTVSLTTSKTVLRAGESATLTATANQRTDFGPYVIRIFDVTTSPGTSLRACEGTTCTYSVRIDSGPPHTFIAYVGLSTGAPPGDIQATSPTVTVSRAAWTLTLKANRTVITPGQAVTFTATANQDVGPGGYGILIYDVTTSQRFGNCFSGTTCSQAIAPTTANHWYVAYVAPPSSALPPPDVQARSNHVNIQVDGGQTRGCGNRTGTANPTVHREDPVNTATGALCLPVTDLRLPGLGIAFELTRTYNSADTTSGPLGPGWTFPYGASLLGAGTNTVTVRAEDGQRTAYARLPGGSYTGAPGAASTLSEVAGGYRLTTPHRDVYTFDASGALTSLTDRHGFGLTMGYTTGQLTSVTDTAGRVVTFTHTGALLTRVALPDGRAVGYGYTNGRLTSVTDPAGATTTYDYEAGGRLTTVTDPLGHTVTRTVYDPSTGRVSSQYDALDNETTFGWDPATGTATTTDARGGVTTDMYMGNVLVRSIDPTGAETEYGYDENLRVTHVTDPLGRLTTLTYDAAGNVLTRRSPEPFLYLDQYTYDADNNLRTAVDARGVTVVTNTYDSAGRLATSTDAVGGVTTFHYSRGAELASVTDPRDETTTYEHDTSGNVTATVRPLGARTTFGYDASGRLVERVDPRGNVSGADEATRAAYRTTFEYDAGDRLVRVVDPRGGITGYEYDAAGRLLGHTDPVGQVTRYGYDDARRLTTLTEPPNPVTGATTTYGYDATGNLTSVTSPLGHRTRYGYDLAARRTSVVEPRGNEPGATASDFTTTYTFDAAGNLTGVAGPSSTGTAMTVGYDNLDRPIAATDALGHTTSTTYDPVGNVLTVTDPLGATRAMTYDATGRLVTTTDELGNTTTSTYDAAGNLTERRSPLGTVVTYAYDGDGRLISLVDPRGNAPAADPADFTTTLAYDPAGNLTSRIDPLGNRWRWTYDDANNVTTAVDPNGHTTGYAYDLLDRLVLVRGPDVAAGDVTPTTGATHYAYDAVDNLIRRTDPLGHATSYEYDSGHRLVAVTDPLVRSRTFGYDAAGNRTSLVTPRGTTLASYDALGQLTAVDYSDGTPDVTYTYDAAGRRTAMGDGVGRGPDAAQFEYDDSNRLVMATRSGHAFAYTYDAAGNLTGRTYPDGATVALGYDDDSRVSTVTYAGGTTGYGYDAAGNLLTTTLPAANGHVETRTVDRAGRLTGVRNTRGSTVLSAFDHTLDPAGNPTRITTTRGIRSTTSAYEYDAADRLVRTCPGVQTCTGATTYATYGYDSVGNRTVFSHDGGVLPGTTYLYDAADQLVTETTGTTVTRHAHDADGNLTTSTTLGGAHRDYTYDLANRLTSATVRTGPLDVPHTDTYTFDGAGNRVSRSRDEVPVEQIEWDTTTSLPTPALRRDPDGSLRQRVVAGLAAIALTESDGTSYLHHDLLGSTTDVTSETGTPQLSYDYDAWGKVTTAVLDPSAPGNDLTYTGQIRDASTGQYHLHARQYDPTGGRFTATDPLAARVADPAISAYGYAANNPLRYTDPSGLFPSIEELWNQGFDAAGGVADAIVDRAISTLKSIPDTVRALSTPVDTLGAAWDRCAETYSEYGGGWRGALACVDLVNPASPVVRGLIDGYELAQEGCVRKAAARFFTAGWDAVELGRGAHSWTQPMRKIRTFRASVGRLNRITRGQSPFNGLVSRTVIRRSGGLADATSGSRLAQHLRLAEQQGRNGYANLPNGHVRYYGDLEQTSGRWQWPVIEWDPETGITRRVDR